MGINMLRTAEIYDNRIVYINLRPYRNHSKTHYYGVPKGCTIIRNMAVKRFCAWVWWLTGVMI
jgi:hypothetical protein